MDNSRQQRPDNERKKADLKVVILGEQNVGKTTFIHRYLDRCFTETITTIGASFFLKRWGSYNIAIWDTAGQERYGGLSSFYCRGAKAAILAFDITSEESFHAIRRRFVPLIDSAETDCLLVVVGTKLDLEAGHREVSVDDALEMATELNKHKSGHNYFETSSKDGRNVDRVFDYIFERLLAGEGVGRMREGVVEVGDGARRASPVTSCC